MTRGSDYAVTWAVQTLKGIHQDVRAKVGMIEELERSGGAEHAEEIESLKAAVRARARALHSLLDTARELEAKARRT